MASLKDKTLKGTFWTFIEQFSVKGLSFFIQIILARLLVPEDFGLIAMITVFIGIGNAIVDSGMTQSLIRTDKPNQADFSTVFYLNIGVSFLAYGIIFFIAPFVAEFYSQGQLTTILRCYALVIPIKSFMAVQNAILTIKMDFKSQALIQIPSLIISSALAVYLAYIDFGVWALVYMHLLFAIFVTIQYWFYSKWRPILIFDKKRLKHHFNFGYKIMLSTILNSFSNDIYNILIGKFFSTKTLGFYNRASVFQKILPLVIGTAMNKVTYPLFSKIRTEKDMLRRTYRKINKSLSYLYFPLIICILLNARELFLIILSDKWIAAAPFFQILLLGALFRPMYYFSMNIIRTYGRSDIVLKVNVISRSIIFVGIIFVLDYGIYYLISFEVFTMIITVIISSFFGGKFIDYKLYRQFKDIMPELLLAVFVGLICWYLKSFIEFNLLLSTIILFIIYAILYITISWKLKYSSYYSISSIIKNNKKKLLKK